MTKNFIITAAAILAATTAGATAGELKPLAGHAINLGNIHGAAYYTIEDKGLRLVATLAEGETGSPVRFVSTLSEGQTMVIEVPRSSNHVAKELTFRRTGDRIVVEDASDLRAALTD